MNSINNVLADRAADLFEDGQNILFQDNSPTEPVDEPNTSYTEDFIENSQSPYTPQEENLDPSDTDTESINTVNNIDINSIKQSIYSIKNQLDGILRKLDCETTSITSQEPDTQTNDINISIDTTLPTGEKIVEGVFDGEKMVGSDGQQYTVPPNYASKSKLIEGDMMKLTITPRGAFIYKQIGPIERRRIVGELICDIQTDQWSAISDGNTYRILKASVTFYKGNPGNEVVLLIPSEGSSTWAAVENIIS